MCFTNKRSEEEYRKDLETLNGVLKLMRKKPEAKITWAELSNQYRAKREVVSRLEHELSAARRELSLLDTQAGCSHGSVLFYTIADGTGTRGCYECDRLELTELKRQQVKSGNDTPTYATV